MMPTFIFYVYREFKLWKMVGAALAFRLVLIILTPKLNLDTRIFDFGVAQSSSRDLLLYF